MAVKGAGPMGGQGIFAGADPFLVAQRWLAEAEATEPNDPNAMAMATVDASGLPNVRMVLLKEIESFGGPPGAADGAFVFYTNYTSAKAAEIEGAGKAAFVLHWKSLRRQIRVRGLVSREEGPQADAYFSSRSLTSRLGAWASHQSRPLSSRESLMADVAKMSLRHGTAPNRPEFWGGYRIRPLEIEFWADGAFRLHDRFRWTRNSPEDVWATVRLFP